jgi:signal transduction histidine kinase
MTPGSMTLRIRILLLGVGTAALVLVLAGVPLALVLRAAAYNDAEGDARGAAQSTADYLSAGSYTDAVVKQYVARLNARGSVRVSVVMPDGATLGAGLPAGLQHPPDGHHDGDHDGDHDGGNGGAPPTQLGTVSSATVIDVAAGRVVQIMAHTEDGDAQIYALAPASAVHDEVIKRALMVGAAALVLLAVAAVAAETTSRRLTRPLRRTAKAATALSGGDLLARAPVEGPPEVAAVAVELNALAERIDELLMHERERMADLSHRLRTPLTAVRLTVEALPPSAEARELEAHVAALERALTQSIQAARRPQREGVHPRCDAVAVVAERVDFWSPLIEEQGRRLTLRQPDREVPVRAAAEDLGAAIDALLENVIAHTAEGVAVELAVHHLDGVPVVDVLDGGPGIPPDALSRGRSDRGSTGLGLDIARSFAEGTGGGLSLVQVGALRGVRLTLRAPSSEPVPEV